MQYYKVHYVQKDGSEHWAYRQAESPEQAQQLFQSAYPQYTVMKVSL